MPTINDYFTGTTNGTRPEPTTVTGIRAISGTTLQCNALTGWEVVTPVHFVTYKVDANGAKIAGSQCDWKGIASGTTITQLTLKAGTDVGNAIGDVVVCMPTAAWAEDLVAGVTTHTNADGTLKTASVQSALGLGTDALNGWNPLAVAVNSVTANGNRSYNVVFASDVSATISNGMKLRTTRTVAAPNTSFLLDGSNDYYNDTSVSGMTFTDDFSVSAWVYCTAYQQSGIVSRRNASGGWVLYMGADGTIVLSGHNAATANYRRVISYQSIPLNRWVHIAAQLDMSTYTAAPTTCYVMIDGVNVPASVAQGGTNPTSLNQSGNLEIGSYDGGGNPFPGYINQVAIYSAKVTQATHLAAMHQGLTGSETSLVSAYSNGSTTDLNTTNANNLTAQGGATTVASSPFGNRGVSTTLDYGLVMNVATTTVTVQVPEGCTIPTSGGVSAVAYSTQAAPYGFITDKGRWEVMTFYAAATNQSSPTNGTVYNLGSWRLYIPIGNWSISLRVLPNAARSTAGIAAFSYCVSTSSSTMAPLTGVLTDYYYIDNGTSATNTFLQRKYMTDYYNATAGITVYVTGVCSAAGMSAVEFRNDLNNGSLAITPSGL